MNSTAASLGISAEKSPEGHWSKNFAALSVHRYLWEYESSSRENVYGLFASHGALLVANSERDLEVHDVKNGWDWA